MDLIELALQVHLISTVFMAGLCWFVQVVHYPLMERVGFSGWDNYQKGHTARTSLVVVPAMLAELGTGTLLVWAEWGNVLFLLNYAALVVIWLSTFLIQVPIHNHLLVGWDSRQHTRLVQSNWVRTILWSLRTILLFLIVF
ncbi:MAG: hypothetical protein AAGH79_11215 [Bacteroidota bacterium]